MSNFSVFNKSATNYMDPHNWKWTGGYGNPQHTKPDINKLDKRELESTNAFNARESLKTILQDGRAKYIKINHGARKGTIAVVEDFDRVDYKGFMYAGKTDRITLTFDNGKSVKMKFVSLFINLKDDQCAELLPNYFGKTVDMFTKTKREAEVPLDIFDAFGKKLEVGDWVMSSRFDIGKIKRVSAKGTMWINFIGQDGRGNAALDVRCSDPDTFAKIIVPDEFDSVSQIVDYELGNMIADLAIDFKGAK